MYIHIHITYIHIIIVKYTHISVYITWEFIYTYVHLLHIYSCKNIS